MYFYSFYWTDLGNSHVGGGGGGIFVGVMISTACACCFSIFVQRLCCPQHLLEFQEPELKKLAGALSETVLILRAYLTMKK